ncbi:MAG: nicotinate-nucleotide adenylyltransferase [Thermomicrobiales bacterium]
MEKRIGVFGGTFDPIHHGHLILASELHHALGLERVIFVPARRPPHKTDQELSGDRHRLAMVRLAIAADPRFEISLVEMERVGPSYSAETVEELGVALPGATLVFLMGEDSLRDLPAWHQPERIVAHAILGVAQRPDVKVDIAAITTVLPAAQGRIELVSTPEIAISSSDIRQRVADGRPIAFHVPQPVERYIAEHDLYRQTSG